MPWYDCIWSPEVLDKIASRGVTVDEVEFVVENPEMEGLSHSSKRPLVEGYAHTGRYLVVIYEMIDDVTVMPATAYTPEKY
ncbi:MAG: hypothetical protein CMJ47_11445 [Planctomyces sp.]|nr:hypothetical protein [Planctomyces sp.]